MIFLLKASLLTVFQSVRGTKQFWFVKKSNVMAIIQEYGSPTLFLTFSCAKYDSPEIEHYLHKMNDVPSKYSILKLCCEDPISVSRKFSQKFHDFFSTVILKGSVLRKVTHFFWKKEYQGRGAPHYHVILWIEDAPVIGRGAPEDVLKWIKSRIRCKIPDEKTNPELGHQISTPQMKLERAKMVKLSLKMEMRKKVFNCSVKQKQPCMMYMIWKIMLLVIWT